MICPAWKTSLNSEEDEEDTNIENTCDTLLIEDTFLNSDTSMYNPDTHCDKY